MKSDPLEGFKRVASDQHTMTLRHPKGHEVKIATRALSPEMREKLMAIPQHLYDGGVAQPIPIQVGSDPGPSVEPALGQEMSLPPVAPPQAEDPGQPKADPDFQKAYNMFRQKAVNEQAPSTSGDTPENQSQWTEAANQFLYNKRKNEAVTGEQDKAKELAVQSKAKDAAQKTIADFQQEVKEAQKLGIAPPPVPQKVKSALEALESAGSRDIAGVPNSGVGQLTDPAAAQRTAAEQQQLEVQKVGDVTGSDVTGKYLNQGIGMRISGLNQEAKDIGELGQKNAAIEQQKSDFLHESAQRSADNLKWIQGEHDEFVKAYQDGKIDPNRYMGSLTTGERASTVIGLILGGIGGGLLHQENAALKYLNQLVDRDVDAQKANAEKTLNVYKANLNLYKTKEDAEQATKADLLGAFASDLEKQAQLSKNPLARDRAKQAIGEIYTQNAKTFGDLAGRKAMQQMMAAQSNQVVAPEVKLLRLKQFGQVDEPTYNKLSEKLDTVQGHIAMRDKVLGAFEQLKSINTVANWAAHPVETKAQIDSILGPNLENLTRDQAGRVSPVSVDLLKPIFMTRFHDDKTADIQRGVIANMFNPKIDSAAGQLKAYGLDIGSGSRFNGQGQKKIQLGAPKI